ncbi:predicted protein [Plenodomus lingam JN3]|uniref:Predicted protein n=1 Tax=Leptosphaeria maculans (strain JN3 / isolate v23.1.3 / race Av1-4-5-6-7-8) TaxID=985895 RepID=E4ZNT5_LEPMJ|nr:predicted protein [Plenodomus lingam JN3]CBX93304.1 predicted protein [Plenodomus lingam JN3]
MAVFRFGLRKTGALSIAQDAWRDMESTEQTGMKLTIHRKTVGLLLNGE